MSYTSLLNTATLSEFTDLVEKEFKMLQDKVVPQAQQLFITEDLSANSGDTRRYDEVDTETFASLKTEGDDASKVSAGVGYNKTMTAKRVATEIEITWEMRRYNKRPQVTAMLTNLGTFCPQRLELDLTHRLTFATSSTYVDKDGETVTVTGGDGNPVVYATHSLANSSTTWRNRVANDPILSQGALEAAEELADTNVLSNFGERRVMPFNVLITGTDPNTCRTAKQILQSTADIDAAQSGVLNYYAGAYRQVKLPYLATTATGAYDSTKKKWWGIASIGNGMNSWQAYLGIFEPNNMKAPEEDVHNDNWTYGSRMSYGICVLSGKGLIMSCPTS